MDTAQTTEYISQLELKNKELTKTISNTVIKLTEYETLLKKKDDNIANLEKENAVLTEKLKLALYRQFCRHAEKFKGIGQPLLFDSDEKAAPKVLEKVPVAAHERTKSKRGRKRIADNVPRLDPIVVDISEEEKQCACGHEMVQIKAETFERLVIIPEQVFVQPYIVKSYACHYCEGSGDEEKPAVRHGKIPSNIMPGSIASPELLAFIFTKKYCDGIYAAMCLITGRKHAWSDTSYPVFMQEEGYQFFVNNMPQLYNQYGYKFLAIKDKNLRRSRVCVGVIINVIADFQQGSHICDKPLYHT
jgi:hypothetical protein